MELTLNLVWVGVAVAGIVLQWITLSRAVKSSDRSASTWQKIVAMGCALVILFFVISMTDDLHDQAILFEEKKPSRILSEITRPTLAPARGILFVFLLFFSNPILSPNLTAARRPLDSPQVFFTSATVCDCIDGRAPPLSLA
jgi:FtsH-binding integral membrane protein